MERRDERLPLPSEDTGDLAQEPADGQTDDYLVATEEGVPYTPPAERVLSEARESESGADVAGTDPTDAGELEREDGVQPDDRALPRDDELQADVVEALRSSDVPAGDRLRVRSTDLRSCYAARSTPSTSLRRSSESWATCAALPTSSTRSKSPASDACRRSWGRSR